MITNKLGLPDSIVRAIENDSYSAGNSDISVTSLIDSPKIVSLKKKHRGEIVEDASDRIWSLIGQSVHTIVERASTDADIAERRLFAEVAGWNLSGQFDLLSDATLIDFKITSVWTVIHAWQEGKPEWENQLNVLDWLCRKNGLYVEKLQIIAILRDWSKFKALEAGYPDQQVVVIPIPRWTEERQEEYVLNRVLTHQEAINDPPPCTAEEQWRKPEKWAVMKPRRKSAVRVFDTEEEASAYRAENVEEGYIEFRPGDAVRCSKYCSVAQFCDQYKEMLNG
jgi:hypothetical protein